MENQEKENKVAENSVYVSIHPNSLSELKDAPPKDDEKEERNFEEQPGALNDAPIIPSGFDIWVDVKMSIKLKTKQHPEGEWVTLWCDDRPSPDPSNGLYYFWAWWKSSYNKDQEILHNYGVEIKDKEYSWHAPCAIAIAYEDVIQDPYN